MTQRPKPVALVGADAEFGINALEGARTHAKRLGLDIVSDQRYPPNTLEFGSVIRAIKATNPDLVFVGSYPPDIDDETLAAYVHQKHFSTVVVEISFNTRREWTQPQILMTQFQHVNGNDLAEFDQTRTQVILYPSKFKSGDLIYPFPPDGH